MRRDIPRLLQGGVAATTKKVAKPPLMERTGRFLTRQKHFMELTNRPVCAGIQRNLIGAATPPCKGGEYLSA